MRTSDSESRLSLSRPDGGSRTGVTRSRTACDCGALVPHIGYCPRDMKEICWGVEFAFFGIPVIFLTLSPRRPMPPWEAMYRFRGLIRRIRDLVRRRLYWFAVASKQPDTPWLSHVHALIELHIGGNAAPHLVDFWWDKNLVELFYSAFDIKRRQRSHWSVGVQLGIPKYHVGYEMFHHLLQDNTPLWDCSRRLAEQLPPHLNTFRNRPTMFPSAGANGRE